jgi:DNA-binding NarL/FixJ family response regulator
MAGMPTFDATRSSPLRVVVVDADDLVRESLARLLGIGDRLEVVGHAGGTERAIELILAERPDIVVIDPRIPELASGLALIDRIRAVAPAVCVVALGSAEFIEKTALSDSVDSCVRKTFNPRDLTAAILLAGGREPAR